MRSVILAFSAVLASTVAISMAGAATSAGTQICTQLKGPKLPTASYLSSVSGIKSHGNVWTILATRVKCSTAVSISRKMLPRWKVARLGASLPWPGYTCFKMIDAKYTGRGKSSGGFLCHRGTRRATSPFAARTFAARETYPYSVKQVKQFFGLK
jgi:hypothetical protein